MDHPDWPAFMAAIVANPYDDTVRLGAADFLEENGDSDRAAFIRIQIALASLEANGDGKSLAADELRKKERAFLGPLSMYPALWATEDCPELAKFDFRGGGRDPLEGMSVVGADQLKWHRGFVEDVQCSAEMWLRSGEAIRKRQPIRTVGLTDHGSLDRTRWWAMLPLLRGLHGVWLETGTPPEFVNWLTQQLPGVRLWIG